MVNVLGRARNTGDAVYPKVNILFFSAGAHPSISLLFELHPSIYYVPGQVYVQIKMIRLSGGGGLKNGKSDARTLGYR